MEVGEMLAVVIVVSVKKGQWCRRLRNNKKKVGGKCAWDEKLWKMETVPKPARWREWLIPNCSCNVSWRHLCQCKLHNLNQQLYGVSIFPLIADNCEWKYWHRIHTASGGYCTKIFLTGHYNTVHYIKNQPIKSFFLHDWSIQNTGGTHWKQFKAKKTTHVLRLISIR